MFHTFTGTLTRQTLCVSETKLSFYRRTFFVHITHAAACFVATGLSLCWSFWRRSTESMKKGSDLQMKKIKMIQWSIVVKTKNVVQTLNRIKAWWILSKKQPKVPPTLHLVNSQLFIIVRSKLKGVFTKRKWIFLHIQNVKQKIENTH